jgi:hypothetical protein
MLALMAAHYYSGLALDSTTAGAPWVWVESAGLATLSFTSTKDEWDSGFGETQEMYARVIKGNKSKQGERPPTVALMATNATRRVTAPIMPILSNHNTNVSADLKETRMYSLEDDRDNFQESESNANDNQTFFRLCSVPMCARVSMSTHLRMQVSVLRDWHYQSMSSCA